MICANFGYNYPRGSGEEVGKSKSQTEGVRHTTDDQKSSLQLKCAKFKILYSKFLVFVSLSFVMLGIVLDHVEYLSAIIYCQ
jgi:hypothetical protein